eukprot:jgi/Astpho2/3649/Aster-07852
MSAAFPSLPACLCHFKVCRRQSLHSRVRQTQVGRSKRHGLHCSAQAAAVQTGTQELVQWLQQRGAPQTPCQITGSRNGLQLELTHALQPGETVFSIPSSCWITADTVRKSAIGRHTGDLAAWLQLALFLVQERAQPSSQWGPYVQSLPEDPDLLVLWPEGDLQLLEGSQLLGTVLEYRQFFEVQWQEVECSLVQQHPDAFPADVFTWESFLWAVATVRARIHAPLQGQQAALVPFADLVQHRRGRSQGWKLQSGGMGFGKSQALSLAADRQLEAGEVVTMNFDAERVDSQILLDYGVVDTDSPQAGFLLTLSIPDDDKFLDDKLDILELNGLQQASTFTLFPNRAPSQEMTAFLRLMNLQGGDAFLLESLFRNQAWGFMQVPVSEGNEASVCSSMSAGCRQALKAYPTSIDGDLALLRDTEPGSRQHKAVAVRLGEKETLDVVQRYFEDRSRKLKQLEYYQERRLKGLGLLDDNDQNTWDGFFQDGVA